MLMKCIFMLHFIWIFTVCQSRTTSLGFPVYKGFQGFMLSLAEVNNQCFVWIQGFFSGVSGAVIRPLSQWQMPTFFPNLNKKKSQSEGHFYVNQYSLQIAFIFKGLLIKIKQMIRNKSDSMQFKRPCLRKYYKNE